MAKRVKRRPEDYQVTIEGQNYCSTVADLSTEELQQEVCYQMDVIEALEAQMEEMSKLFRGWRVSKELPGKG